MKVEMLVIGGGIVGCAIAERLATGGASVCLVERDCIGGAATAASMGHLLTVDEDPAELTLSTWSCQRWRALAERLPACADYRRTGTLWIARHASEMAEAERKRIRLAAAGVASEVIGSAGLYEREPALAAGLAGALFVPSDAIVYPPVAALHLLRCGAAAGASLRIGVSVCAIDRDTVKLSDGSEIRAEAIIVASGCSAPELIAGLPIRRRKGHLLITTPAAPMITHQLVELGYSGGVHGSQNEAVAFNAQPRPNGQLLLGSTRQYDDHTTAIVPRLISALIERGRQFLPGLNDLCALRTWTGFRPTTPDHRPLIGAWPGQERIWLACGHEGMGITTSLGTADLLAAQIMGHVLPFDDTAYAPGRFNERARHAA